ncbi:hypothetical protein [Halobaculum lipolyticum]|uniref:Uncharacterized protein n=1 Tax=Halobaculum lipolyticum TaxID=3032001 RepID=A0ABD5WE79_9EURY|nr:hypothetical protein [Halobaculum sp. DT31]
MVEVVGFVLTVTGGVISGAVGFGVAEYRERSRRAERRRRWYGRTARLAERIGNAQPDLADTDAKLEHAPVIRETCGTVHDALAAHLLDAPAEADPELVASCERLIGNCYTIRETDVDGSVPRGFFAEASAAADLGDRIAAASRSMRERA